MRYSDLLTPLTIIAVLILSSGYVSAQEYSWYHTFDSPRSSSLYSIGRLLSGENVVAALVTNAKNVALRGYSSRGDSLWEVVFPPYVDPEASAVEYRYSAMSGVENPAGGWWIWTSWVVFLEGEVEQRSIRYLVTEAGQITSRDTINSVGYHPFSDGALGSLGWNQYRFVLDDVLVYSRHLPSASQPDSIVIDIQSVLRYFRGYPSVAWTRFRDEGDLIALSDQYTGESTLLGVSKSGEIQQEIRFDAEPTHVLDGTTLSDGSILLLARDITWGPERSAELKLMWVGGDASVFRTARLGIEAGYGGRLVGELSNGDLIATWKENNAEVLYRLSSEGKVLDRVVLYDHVNYSIVIGPDDELYISWNSYYFGRVNTQSFTSSIREDDGGKGVNVMKLDLSEG